MHELVSAVHAVITRRHATVVAGNHKPLARVAVFALETSAAVAGDDVRTAGAVFARELSAAIAAVYRRAAKAVFAFAASADLAGGHVRAAELGAVFAHGGVADVAGGHPRFALQGALETLALVAAVAEGRANLEHAVSAKSSAAWPIADSRVGGVVAVVAPEPLARVAGHHVLRILRADLHATAVGASLAKLEFLANVALGDVELAAADQRLQTADRLPIERVDAIHREGREVALARGKDIPPEGARVDARAARETEALEPAAVAQRLERVARELQTAHIQHGQLSAGAPQDSRHILIA